MKNLLRYCLIAVSITTILLSCDDTTGSLGLSMSEETDHLSVENDTFNIVSRSIAAGAVVSRNTVAYLGKIRDPETNAYITSSCMLQYATVEGLASFPDKSLIANTKNGLPVADSCEIRLFYTNSYGDKTTPMKFKVMELSHPMTEISQYYTDFNPVDQGYIRSKADNGIEIEKTFTLENLNLTEEDLEETTTPHIVIKITGEYVDKQNRHYDNFGTYIMQMYYEHPEYFQSNYLFTKNVMPGFYFQYLSGLGAMAYVNLSQLRVYYSRTDDEGEPYLASFGSTEEVLQTTNIENDQTTLNNLLLDDKCTYLKSPAGIFTELTIPVEDIMRGHENDTINTAKLVLPRVNNSVTSDYSLEVPKQLLMIPAGELNNFFEDRKLPDNKTAFYTEYASNKGSYTFSNIASLITYMYKNRYVLSDWDKVVVIPVTISTTTIGSSSSQKDIVTSVVHDMSLTGTKLVRGYNGSDNPVTISVIYSKFK